ncbi:hypothetical protein A3C17_04050 [Candidatus Uhrbacteria bacterium RIFCSPHIGHO2_02_FULL_53_13]|uniref:AAA+ ATPase domain-containing protein n=2 Tax=Candidatus Uhriibacteriota TaxID=1752732 RepID=A0A1F7TX22_9BACT|nr:MAG: hypothetical protein A3C17_04050 [Candidatus Uhrbacteria bacterium RIFCSPHIGHO2_02_FULL_53_13]OGL89247.1 MAG: hypothetical protein A3I45_03765 [Candidatus Uhrbacteria bacterium RIFCSPLOWO2_02_FULL_53_10]
MQTWLIQALVLLAVAIFLYAAWRYQKDKTERGPSFGGFTGHLSEVTRDLTAAARANKIDPVTGRENELDRIVHILMRRTKNNPLLLGEAGVGKTAVVEGLALRIARDSVPQALKNKSVLALDINALVSETKYRGDLEQRLQKITRELEERAKEVILFIDEIHLISQMGGAEGSLNVSDVLKPSLARGDVQMIGATTWREFDKYIKPDEAFARRLQPVLIDEPTPARALEILRSLRSVYENFHGVKITDDALKAAVQEADEKIDYRYLPDSAIDLIDEASAKVAIEGEYKHHVALGAVHAAAKIGKEKVTRKDIRAVIDQWVLHGSEDKARDARHK